jgi:hypothetical protein
MSAILLFLAQLSTVGTARPADPPRPQSDVPVTLTVRIAEGRRQFRPGEVIPIELEFSSAIPKRFVVDGATYDRSGRLTMDEFRVDPADAVTDPMLDYFSSIGGSIGGGLRGIGTLGEQPFIVKLELNDWFRFDQPQTFRLSIRSGRVSDDATTTRSIVPVESNTVSFDIVPRDAAWEATELEAARRILDAKGSLIDRRHGCRMMRFLGTDAAALEMIHRYGSNLDFGCDFDYMAGLFSAPNREHVVRQMENGLRAADQPVTASYLRTLATLSVYLEHPEFRPAQTREAKGRLVADGDMARHRDLIEAASALYADILAAALPDKTDRARAITIAERQDTLARSSSASGPAVAREQLAAAFLALPVERQASLLGFQWSTIASPAMIPVLRRLVESSTASRPVADLALRRLFAIAPEEARPSILRQIHNPPQGATLKTLGSLPDTELPELDETLAANVETGEDFEARGDFEGARIRAELLHRYASNKIADRILHSASERLPRMACASQSAILAYFLRVDDGIGKTLLDRALASRASTGCRTSLGAVAALRMTPIVEARAIADLDDSDPDVATAAIETLGRHGSPAALGPLSAAFERWRAMWEGRAPDLQYSHAADRPHARQGMVEDAFRQALGHGQGWLTQPSELRALRALCVTDNCRTQTSIMIAAGDRTRITIVRLDEPGDSWIQLAQYQLQSISALEQKLSQYPRGTSFTLDAGALDDREAAAVVSEIRTFAGTHAIAVTSVPRR